MKNKILIITLLIFNQVFSQNNFPGFDIIGRGYDVFDEYANNKSIKKYKIFDFSKTHSFNQKFNYKLPKIIDISDISAHSINTFEGSSINEYVENMSKKMGLNSNVFFFKGSFNKNFSQNSIQLKERYYYTYMDINTKWRISLDIRNKGNIYQYLDDQFKNDLENINPELLFSRYGTHYIASAYLGGRIEYSTVSEINSNFKEEILKNTISAKVNKIRGGIDYNENNTNTQNQIIKNTRFNIVGGNSVFTNNIETNKQYKEWSKSIVESPVLSNFDNESLVPIWSLTQNEKRKQELINYYNKVIISKNKIPRYFKQDKVLENENITKDITIFINGFNINQDCDTDESGDFIYNIKVFLNDIEIKQIENSRLSMAHIPSGNFLNINNQINFKISLNQNNEIRVTWKLTEIDKFTTNELVGQGSHIHRSPFNNNSLYNFEDNNGTKFWKENLWHSKYCNSEFYYKIMVKGYSQTAIDYGNKGWEEFLNKNYKKAQEYNKKALIIDNSIWNVQYNVALIYLIEQNPIAVKKYEFITNVCDDINSIRMAYKDIIDFEKRNGIIENSEQIKILLKSKLNVVNGN